MIEKGNHRSEENREGRERFSSFKDYFAQHPVNPPESPAPPPRKEPPKKKEHIRKEIPIKHETLPPSGKNQNERQRFGSIADYAAAMGYTKKSVESSAGEATIPKELAVQKETAVSLVGRLRDHLEIRLRRGRELKTSERTLLSDRNNLIVETLQTDPKVLENQGIRIIARGPVDDDGKLAVEDPLTSYDVIVTFGTKRRDSQQKFLRTNRYALGAHRGTEAVAALSEMANVDELVAKATTLEIQPETVKDRYDRHIKELSIIDKYIRQQKEYGERTTRERGDKRQTVRMDVSFDTEETMSGEALNAKKHRVVRDYLLAAEALRRSNPEVDNISPTYSLEEGSDIHHRKLVMRQFSEQFNSKRIFDPTSYPVVITETNNTSGTQLNTGLIKDKAERYRAGSTSPEDEVAFQISEMLGLE